MELTALFNVIQTTLCKQGFKLSPLMKNGLNASFFVLDNELEKRKVSPTIEYTAYYGNCIEVRKTAHRNGAKADTSYYVAISDWNASSSKDYKKIKLMRSQTEETLVRKINKFALEYKQYLQERLIEKQIEMLLGGK